MTKGREKVRVLQARKADPRNTLTRDSIGAGGQVDPRLRPFIDAMADLLLKDLLRKKT